MKFFKYIAAFFLVSLLFGCVGRYQAPNNITTPVNGLTKAQVKQAILDNGTKGKAAFGTWKMVVLNSNTIRGHLFNRKFEIVVDIPYSATGYSINYVSVNPNLQGSNGKVHRNYNRWVNNLDVKIRESLFRAK